MPTMLTHMQAQERMVATACSQSSNTFSRLTPGSSHDAAKRATRDAAAAQEDVSGPSLVEEAAEVEPGGTAYPPSRRSPCQMSVYTATDRVHQCLGHELWENMLGVQPPTPQQPLPPLKHSLLRPRGPRIQDFPPGRHSIRP